MTNLLGKIVVVTGGGSGIGKGISEVLAKNGAKVYIASRSEATGEATAQEIREQGGDAVWIQTDVSNSESVRALMDHIQAVDGKLDHICNNAGVELYKTMEDTSEDEFDRIIATDLKGVFLMSKFGLPLLRQSDYASIVNISSVHAHSTIPGIGIYAAAKGGLNALTRSMALELGPEIRVIAVCPGFVDTPIWERFLSSSPDPERVDQETVELHAVGRRGMPKDIAELVNFLMSEHAGFITGSAIYIDGGLTSKLY